MIRPLLAIFLFAGGWGAILGSARAAEPDSTRVTHDGLLKQRPAWSPDGKSLVFARHQGDTIFLFLRELSTGVEERLSDSKFPEFDAVFSPDGKELLLAYDKLSPNQGDIDVSRIRLAERMLTPIATTQGALSHEESPSWSPDGKRFAFTSTRHGNQELYIAPLDGGEWKRLTDDPAIDAHPSWSPDGKTIAFATSRWGDLEIALVDADGGNLRRLTESRGLDDYPAWSPDGRFLAFTSNRDGNLEIYVQPFNLGGAAEGGPRAGPSGPAINATQRPSLENFPAWTPDGRLGFVSNRDDGIDVYQMPWPAAR